MTTPDNPPAKIPEGFSVVWRNFGHWDIVSRNSGRLFRIRGTPGKWVAMDERQSPYPRVNFKDFGTCVAFIMGELMHESLESDGFGNNTPLTERNRRAEA